MNTQTTIEAGRITQALERLSADIAEALAQADGSGEKLALIGIANGGLPFCQKLATSLRKKLGCELPVGSVDMTFHRDDVMANPIPAAKSRTDLPFEIEGATLILADDVIHSGRTVRAALNEIFDLGRPKRVYLAVLCDRGGRRLPVQPDFVGLVLDTDPSQKVKVNLDTENPSLDTVEILQA
ncbi:bifunctional pyr operon transcriptional regulator/uracil phosphoribosyltransferase PyrR [Ruficoccus amylovorans]|uniref:Bifunctional pyr operon transcriptional regulator/uracil phosphoribosyltransferase PyrR n=1 Tax=Ruficoccus amylovorans TaxID=1804625 RepID=A0A842HGZ9_9BACT|nr:bifunctional pyr operon transcriptional regulator/uracil phosphoribosyltransferase PyrR [Ruficoccus amylovorans]MBC2594827.1 bifunctional pyr operon transcriptional regulator/uracil phosphoribosyltransferase PyrR [Ruficoccus amylovorans]